MHDILKDKSVIFFDVGYTLDRPASGDWMLTAKFNELAGERFGKHSRLRIAMAMKAGYRLLMKKAAITDEDEEEILFRDFYGILSKKLKLGLTDAEITEIAADRTRNMNNYVIYPDVRKVLSELSKTHRLGIISDTWPSIDSQLRSFDILKYFSFFTYSCSVGAFKPDRRIFMDALGKCGCDPRETVFIDDSPHNLDGAAELGMGTVLIASNPASDVPSGHLKIHSLSELL